jgi:hypothetical protein
MLHKGETIHCMYRNRDYFGDCSVHDSTSQWSYDIWIYNYMYLCNQCLSPLMLWDQISIRARCTILCDKVCQWLMTGMWFSLGLPETIHCMYRNRDYFGDCSVHDTWRPLTIQTIWCSFFEKKVVLNFRFLLLVII